MENKIIEATTKRDGLFWLKEILKCSNMKGNKEQKMKSRKIELKKAKLKNKERSIAIIILLILAGADINLTIGDEVIYKGNICLR